MYGGSSKWQKVDPNSHTQHQRRITHAIHNHTSRPCGTALAAGAAYQIAELRKEVESAHRKADSAQKEAEKAQYTLDMQTKMHANELESMRREYDAKIESIQEIDRVRRECNVKLETAKSSWWSSWFG